MTMPDQLSPLVSILIIGALIALSALVFVSNFYAAKVHAASHEIHHTEKRKCEPGVKLMILKPDGTITCVHDLTARYASTTRRVPAQ